MADPDLTRRLRDLVEANAEMNPGMVNGDILAAADRIDQLEQQLADLHTQRREHDKVVAWADDALARRDARITELIAERDAALAEVERLRALDQRTDPELARALNNLAATYDGSMYLVNAAADLRAAARLLGGDQ